MAYTPDFMSVQFDGVLMRTHLNEMMAFERMLREKTSRPIDNGPNIEAAFEQWVRFECVWVRTYEEVSFVR